MLIEVIPLELKKMWKVSWFFSFGSVFYDRMLYQNYKRDKGWYDAKICPYQAFLLEPLRRFTKVAYSSREAVGALG